MAGNDQINFINRVNNIDAKISNLQSKVRDIKGSSGLDLKEVEELFRDIEDAKDEIYANYDYKDVRILQEAKKALIIIAENETKLQVVEDTLVKHIKMAKDNPNFLKPLNVEPTADGKVQKTILIDPDGRFNRGALNQNIFNYVPLNHTHPAFYRATPAYLNLDTAEANTNKSKPVQEDKSGFLDGFFKAIFQNKIVNPGTLGLIDAHNHKKSEKEELEETDDNTYDSLNFKEGSDSSLATDVSQDKNSKEEYFPFRKNDDEEEEKEESRENNQLDRSQKLDASLSSLAMMNNPITLNKKDIIFPKGIQRPDKKDEPEKK